MDIFNHNRKLPPPSEALKTVIKQLYSNGLSADFISAKLSIDMKELMQLLTEKEFRGSRFNASEHEQYEELFGNTLRHLSQDK